MGAARLLALALHHCLAPAMAGVFLWLWCGPAWSLYRSGDLEARIRENTDDSQ
jgi:hypothetical protein